jgi:hypothetical protein
MDVRIEAAPMEGVATVETSRVSTETLVVFFKAIFPERVASFPRLSIGGVSLSAVSPDHNFNEGGSLRF